MKRWFVVFVLMAFVFSGTHSVAEATNWGDILGSIGKLGGGSISKGSVRAAGKVTDRDQNPLEGITVTYAADGGGQVSVKTNSEGNYVMNIPKLTSGKWTISGEGWRTLKSTSGSYGYNADLIRNYTMKHDYISGKVTTSSGIPLQWVKLVFEQDGSASGIQEIYTDEYGNYKYVLPESGVWYWVTISLDGYQVKRHHGSFNDENVWNITLYES